MAVENISLEDLTSEMRIALFLYSHCLGKLGGFSDARYNDVARFFGLDPVLKATDISTRFELNPVYIPLPLFNDILGSIKYFRNQYGSVRNVHNETGLSYFISSVISFCQHITQSYRFWERCSAYLTAVF